MATRVFSDNPLRLARIAAGLSMPRLSELSGVNKSTISMIEAGRTRDPSPETLEALAAQLPQMTPASLNAQLHDWQNRRRRALTELTPEGRRVLRMTPEQVRETFTTFQGWRSQLAPTPTAFATMLGIHHNITNEYERGIRATQGLPRGMQGPLMSVLGLSGEYLRVLSELPPS